MTTLEERRALKALLCPPALCVQRSHSTWLEARFHFQEWNYLFRVASRRSRDAGGAVARAHLRKAASHTAHVLLRGSDPEPTVLNTCMSMHACELFSQRGRVYVCGGEPWWDSAPVLKVHTPTSIKTSPAHTATGAKGHAKQDEVGVIHTQTSFGKISEMHL